ncbi:MAG: hypothetical protein J6A47_10200 [Bacilli bacterium]|nr:hypothetical protein [Bacilli bacterium]
MHATIRMSELSPIMKVKGTRRFGAEVVLVPGNYDDFAKKAKELAKENGYALPIHFMIPM